MYLERLTSAGMDTSQYWKSPYWNHFAGTVNDLPNCVSFALGETYEATETSEPFKMFSDRGAGGAPTAKEWYDLWTGKKGIEPRVGGVAVWGSLSAKYGHVAFVLETKDLGASGTKIKVCQSNYGGAYFEVKEYTVRKGYNTAGVGFPYIGCCYNDIPDRRTTRNKDMMQVEIFGEMVRVRKAPNGEVYRGRFCPKGLYTVLDTTTDGYQWVKLDENMWVATDPSWSKIYEPETESALSRAEAEINRLTIQLANTEDLFKKAKKELDDFKIETKNKEKEIRTTAQDLLLILGG